MDQPEVAAYDREFHALDEGSLAPYAGWQIIGEHDLAQLDIGGVVYELGIRLDGRAGSYDDAFGIGLSVGRNAGQDDAPAISQAVALGIAQVVEAG